MNLVAIKILTGDRAKYLGMVFHRAIDRVLATLASLGAGALVLIVRDSVYSSRSRFGDGGASSRSFGWRGSPSRSYAA